MKGRRDEVDEAVSEAVDEGGGQGMNEGGVKTKQGT